MAAKAPPSSVLGGMHTAGIFADMTVDGPEIGTLVLIVDRAKNLPNRRSMGKQDPYCAARLGKEAKKTSTDKRGGQTPRWDQELRFTVHESPDYHNLKVSVFNDDKKTELIGESWVNLDKVVIPGGGQSDIWHPLNCRGKYAGEIRIELTFYDTRQAPSIPPASKHRESFGTATDGQPSLPSGPRQLGVKRRPLPSDPTRASASPPVVSDLSRLAAGHPNGPRGYNSPTNQAIPQQSSSRRLQQREYGQYPDSRQVAQEPLYPPPNDQNDHFLQQDAYVGHEMRDRHSMPSQESMHPDDSTRYSYGANEHLDDANSPHYAWQRRSTMPPMDGGPPPHGQDYQQRPRQGDIPSSHSAPVVPHATASHREQEAWDPHPAHQDVYRGPSPRYEHDFQELSAAYQDPRNPHYNPYDGPPEPPSYGSRHDIPPQHGQYPPSNEMPPQSHRSPVSALQPTVEDEQDEDVPPPPPVHRVSAPALSSHRDSLPSRVSQDMRPNPLRVSPRPEASRNEYGATQSYREREDRGHPGPPDVDRRFSAMPQASSPMAYQMHHSDPTASNGAPAPAHEHRHSYPESFNQSAPSNQSPRYNHHPQRMSMASFATVGQSSRPYHPSHAPQHSHTRPDSSPHHSPQTPQYTNVYQGRPHHPRARSPRDTSPVMNQRSRSPAYPSPHTMNRGMPSRKSVSPRPTPERNSEQPEQHLSSTPFSPDSYDSLNPSVAGSNISGNHDGDSAVSSSADHVDDGPIVTPDGRTIDPSDHLPVHSWAPEPERKGPARREQPTRERERITGAREMGSHPVPTRTRVTVTNLRNSPASTSHFNPNTPPQLPLSSTHSPTAFGSNNPSPSTTMTVHGHSPSAGTKHSPSGRNRLQKRGPPSFSGSPYSQRHGGQPLRERENPGVYNPAVGGPGMAPSGPPIPAKVPIEAPLPVQEDARALGEEMMRIDIGVGGRVRKGRAAY